MKTTMKIVLILLFFALALLMLLHITDEAAARTIFVDDDAPQDGEEGTREHPYNTIQEAVEEAVDGDSVRVYNGSYWAYYLKIYKEISLIGNGSEDTTLGLNYGHGGDTHVVDVYADWVNISGFTIIEAGKHGAGISVSGSNNVRIFDNVFSENPIGVLLLRTTGVTLENNSFLDGDVRISESMEVVLSDNSFREGGVSFGVPSLKHLDTHTIDTTNTINGKPIHYLSNARDVTLPSGAGQVILANCTGITVAGQDCRGASVGILAGFSSNLRIEGNDCSETGTGLSIIGSGELILANNSCLDTGRGIHLVSSYNNTLQSNSCSSSTYGIHLEDSDNNSLISNHCYGDSDVGIYLLGSGNILRENNCSGGSRGIWLKGVHNILEHNICSENYNGIALSGSDNVLSNNTSNSNRNIGICVSNSKRITLSYNICQFNKYGISFYNISESGLSHNTITGNGKGIWIDSTAGSYLTTNLSAHNNTIFGNTEYGIDAARNDNYPINATNNWWGDDSGPYHQANNTAGTGDNITDFVEFGPWLLERINRSPTAYINFVSPELAPEGKPVRFSAFCIDDTMIARYVWSSSIDEVIYSGPLADISLTNLSAGDHILTLKVQDEDGLFSDDVTTTLAIHSRPVATTITISPGLALDTTTITFTGRGSDDGTIVRYAWTSSIDGEFYNGSAPSFTGASLSPGAHTIYLNVQDNHGVWSDGIEASLLLHERPTAHIDSIVPTTPIEKKPVQFVGSGADDGSITRYVWTSSLDGEFYDGADDEVLHPGFSPGEHVIALKVQDDHDVWSDVVSVTLTVTGLPRATIKSIIPGSATEGNEIGFSGKGVTAGSITHYAWRSSIDGEFYNGTRSSFTYSELSPGTHTIYLKVRDNNGFWSLEVEAALEVKEGKNGNKVSSFAAMIIAGVAVTVLVAVLFALFLMPRPKGGYEEDEDSGNDSRDQGDHQEDEFPEELDPVSQSREPASSLPPAARNEPSGKEDFIAPLMEEDDDDDEIKNHP